LPPNKIIETVLKTFTKPTSDKEGKAPSNLWHRGSVILDLYEVQESYTGGGMGVVYKVYHRNWHIPLAVKSPKSEFFESQVQKDNFIRECETWINLGLHPNIVSCYYVREIGGIPRVFCEFIEGGSLKDWITDKRLYEGSQEEVLARMLDIAIQFAWGLQYAHEANLVHQDVKPANVMLREDGTPLVTDFGLAKAKGISGQSIRSDNQQSISVTSGGYTPAYCSPEQFSEQPLTRKTDIWSWAVSVLEMFTGEIIWQGGQLAGGSLDVVLKEGIQHPNIPTIPQELGALLQKCLQYKAEDRPTGMQEISEELQRIYQSVTGKTYSRKYPQAAEIDAGSLNNRAISYLDLGKEAEAEQLFQEALAKHPGHLDTTYNYGIWQWQNAKSDDWTILYQLDACGESLSEPGKKDFYKAQIHLARLDVKSAKECLEKATSVNSSNTEYSHLTSKARSLLAISINPQKKNFIGHENQTSSLVFSPDGNKVITGRLDDVIVVWDFWTNKCINKFSNVDRHASSISISSDGKRLLSGSKNIRLWDLNKNTCIRVFDRVLNDYKISTSFVCFNHDDTLAISLVKYSNDEYGRIPSSSPVAIILWDVDSGKQIQVFEGHTDQVRSVCFSPDGKWILSASTDSTVKLWDVKTGKCVHTYIGHTKAVYSVCFSHDSSCFISGSADKSIILWSVASPSQLKTYQGHNSYIRFLNFSKDGQYILSVDGERALKCWDINSGICVRTFENVTDLVHPISQSPDGKWLLFWMLGGQNNLVEIHRLIEMIQTRTSLDFSISKVKNSLQAQVMDNELQLRLMSISESIKKGEFVEAIQLIKETQVLPEFERSFELREIKKGISSHFSRSRINSAWLCNSLGDGSQPFLSFDINTIAGSILTGGMDYKIRVWDVKNGVCSKEIEVNSKNQYQIKFSNDKSCFLANYDVNVIAIWDSRTYQCIKKFEYDEREITTSCFSPDDSKILSAAYDVLVLWDIATGKVIRTFDKHNRLVRSVSISPDGNFALSGSFDRTIKLWQLDTGRCVNTFVGHHDYVKAVCFSNDGQLALSGESGGFPPGRYEPSLLLWEISSGDCLFDLKGHKYGIESVKFSKDAKWGISGGEDNTIKLWDLTTGNCHYTFIGHVKRVTDLCFFDNDWQLASCSVDGTIKIWQLDWDLELDNAIDSQGN